MNLRWLVKSFMYKSLYLGLLCLLSTVAIYSYVRGTTLPESYALKAAKGDASDVDPALQKWFETHVYVESPLEKKKDDFVTHLNTLSGTPKKLLALRYANTESGKANQSELEEAIAEVASYKAGNVPPLGPYLMEEILQSEGVSEQATAKVVAKLREHGARSCPQKEHLLREINADGDLKVATADGLSGLLERITTFHSRRYKEEALEGFLDNLPQELQDQFRDRLQKQLVHFPKLLEDNEWILKTTQETDKPAVTGPDRHFKQAVENGKRRRCRTAKLNLLKGVKSGDASYLPMAESTALRLDSCFRRKGRSARRKYWRQLRGPLEKAYGFKGAEVAMRKRGLLLWDQDDFQSARTIFHEIRTRAKTNNLPEIEARAIFTLARIEENNSKLPESVALYEEYAKRFPEGARILDAHMALVLLDSILKKYDDAITHAEQIIAQQSQLPIDERSTTALSFALFWNGRLHYQTGSKDLAAEMWRRLAMEYYSTYYGAMGHYMLERVSDTTYGLEPSRSKRFVAQEVFADFDKADQQTITRVQSLLSYGLREEAACEIAELNTEDRKQNKILAKAMFLNASGDWLSTIKLYDSLPRSFRHSLPVGFEKLLFPRSYADSVGGYAERLGLDPDLIFAIIRQESVFNPRALSSAGARGLMQLMPSTARMEARRLGRNYLPRSKRKKLARSTRRRASLYNAETNLALGVHHVHRLLKKYNNPIFVLTSYNASPSATKRWLKKLPTEDFLAFVERIPYNETRMYVKLVLRNYFYYKRWYRAPGESLPHLDFIAQNVSADLKPSSSKPK